MSTGAQGPIDKKSGPSVPQGRPAQGRRGLGRQAAEADPIIIVIIIIIMIIIIII